MREKIAKNFYLDEFECKCGCGFDSVDAMLVHGLQRLRDIMQAPVHINSGCRCAAHNASLDNSSTKSQHILGKAADIRVSGYTPEETLDFAKMLSEFADSGIGIYDTFVHLDVRKGRARWDYRTKK